MQFKLLNFNRVLANFSTSLTGVFIPIIIYKTTNSLQLTFFYLILGKILKKKMLATFKKLILKYTNLSNLIRIIPIAAKYLCLIFLNSNYLLFLLIYSFFYALSLFLKHAPN